MYAAVVDRLHGLDKPSSGMTEVPLKFDKGAQSLRNELKAKHHAMTTGWEAVNKKLAAHIGKYDGLFARLCVIWHCIECTESHPVCELREDRHAVSRRSCTTSCSHTPLPSMRMCSASPGATTHCWRPPAGYSHTSHQRHSSERAPRRQRHASDG